MTKERARATAPAVSRRTLLTALPATGTALALPAVGAAQAPDPLVPLYYEWLDARREWRELADLPGNGNWDDPRSLAAEAREAAIAGQILARAPTSLEGIAVLAALLWQHVSPGNIDPSEFEAAAQANECQAVMAIWRACTGRDDYPTI